MKVTIQTERYFSEEEAIDIAKSYVDLHAQSDIDLWELNTQSKKSRFLEVFFKMTNGTYGEVRQLDLDDWEIEIGAMWSHSGNPIIFTF